MRIQMPVSIKTHNQVVDSLETSIKGGLLEMATDIRNRAVILAPVETGALKNSGVVIPITNGYKIQFGSGRVPYARKRHFENRKNPQTIGYLAKAADSVERANSSKYFKGKV